MTTFNRLVRASGVALCAGAALAAGAAAAQDYVDLTTVNPAMTAVGTVGIVGGLLMLLGMPAWYAVQAERIGRFGTIAFVLVFLGWAGLQVATQPLFTYVAPAVYARPGNADLAAEGAFDSISTGFLSYVGTTLIALNLGLLLFGIAMIRARVFPRLLCWAIAVGPLAVFFLAAVEQEIIAALLLTIAACGLLMATGRVRLSSADVLVPVAAG
jgi:hypothetical protein